MIIDIFFYFIFALIAGVIIALVGFGEGLQNMNDNLLGILLLSCYFIPQEALFGRTLGKLITKTKVVKIDGSKVTFNDVLIRTLCREGIKYIPDSESLHYGLAVSLQARGLKKEARNEFQETLRLNPEFIAATKALKTMSENDQ